MNNLYHCFELDNNRKLKILRDECPEDPRVHFDNIDTIYTVHGKYQIGDKHDYQDIGSMEELHDRIRKEHEVLILRSLFLYDHSGIILSMSSEQFRQVDSHGWDWGQVGFIFITKENWNEMMGNTPVYDEEKLLPILQASLEEYNSYIMGNVYGFSIVKSDMCDLGHEHETELESVWGFYGDDIQENGILDHLSPEDQARVQEQLDIAA